MFKEYFDILEQFFIESKVIGRITFHMNKHCHPIQNKIWYA
jgi:hypothetical protein